MPAPIALFAALAALDTLGVALDDPILKWATKPLLAPVLVLYLLRATGRRHGPVLIGLGFATAGDIALLIPGPVAFATGLGLFLGAQICWTTAFVRAGAVAHLAARRTLLACYLALWAGAMVALAPALRPALAAALGLYGLVLVAMAATAHVLGPRAAWGGAVFVLSDLLIGLGAAGVDFPGRSLLVMPTYALALGLIVTAFAGHGVRARTPAPVETPAPS
ncbi:lysoplasmalogenase family protein [Streptomyces sp. NPDC048507]|uniref:lysoplasmalogenase family protein n=1 Tax=Streptomyces sp. NPDC048507 TaxID=3365560 RepID=UPI00371205CF